jgi:serine/threonine-protein kinase HipA
MGRKRLSRELLVAMNGREVGRLMRLSQGALRFRYSPAWLAEASAMPVSLSMPLSPDPYSGDVVWSFFDNLLPDNREIRSRLQRVVGAESTRPFDLLERVGRDCVGALQLYAGDAPAEPPDVRRIEAIPLSDAWIAGRLRSYRTHPLGMAGDEDFRISIAGAQEKTALLWHEGAWHEPRGATPTTHIFKLPIGPAAHGIDLADSVENEWLCLRIAKAFGLPVPAAVIREFEGQRTLIVERFDRRWSSDGSWIMRLPQEDACQALGVPPSRKYESDGGPGAAAVFDLLLQSLDPVSDRRTFFRALVVYWLLAAIDGHAKNFSLFLLPGGRSRMTPLYDILSAHAVVARGELHPRDLKMAMAVQGKNRHYRWDDIRGRHWITTARAVGFPEREAEDVLQDCVTRGPEIVRSLREELASDFPHELAEPVLDGVLATLERI